MYLLILRQDITSVNITFPLLIIHSWKNQCDAVFCISTCRLCHSHWWRIQCNTNTENFKKICKIKIIMCKVVLKDLALGKNCHKESRFQCVEYGTIQTEICTKERYHMRTQPLMIIWLHWVSWELSNRIFKGNSFS